MTETRQSTDAPEAEALSHVAEADAAIITCDACPVLCRIRPGRTGACDRYANEAGRLTRLDPLLLMARSEAQVPFLDSDAAWLPGVEKFVTGIGSGTTYPD